MEGFRVSEKYRLEIHWSKAIYEQEGLTKLEGCYLSGPAIKEVEQMNQNDFIRLDFGAQYKVFTNDFHSVLFSWGGVKQTPEKIHLVDVIFKNKYVQSVPKLNNDDYIVVDTKNHVPEKHQFFLVYPSYLIKVDGEMYKF